MPIVVTPAPDTAALSHGFSVLELMVEVASVTPAPAVVVGFHVGDGWE